jgi:hypothetical protein
MEQVTWFLLINHRGHSACWDTLSTMSDNGTNERIEMRLYNFNLSEISRRIHPKFYAQNM